MIDILKDLWILTKGIFAIGLQYLQLDEPLLNASPHAIVGKIAFAITAIIAVFGILNRILNDN